MTPTQIQEAHKALTRLKLLREAESIQVSVSSSAGHLLGNALHATLEQYCTSRIKEHIKKEIADLEQQIKDMGVALEP